VVLSPGAAEPLLLPATGTVMGVARGFEFPASSHTIPAGARLLIFSDGVFEIRREKNMVWNLRGCVDALAEMGQRDESIMDDLLEHARELRGSPQLDDDFSIIEVRFA
jgi:sigma-B regulation protein RsbU (phosphoserine phosphatase)